MRWPLCGIEEFWCKGIGDELGKCPNQNNRHFPHYDLTKGKRNQALMKGAIEVTDKQVINFRHHGVIDEDL